ncbi:MAG: class I SAM-dependent methyltransferase, partial [Planctomycetota bacterium]
MSPQQEGSNSASDPSPPSDTETRDFNEELKDTPDHRYAYDFDLDVIHPMLLRSMVPFFIDGNCLELGSYHGDFTTRLLAHFPRVTCVEASDQAAKRMRDRLGDRVDVIEGRFETIGLTDRFANIVMTHVLEHLDDPVRTLRRVNEEWLSPKGRLFVACPNANAPSRQIAVKMGLISHHTAVTPAEQAHGHRITYALDTLERDLSAAGLRVMYRTGVFFKALANF